MVLRTLGSIFIFLMLAACELLKKVGRDALKEADAVIVGTLIRVEYGVLERDLAWRGQEAVTYLT